ncbi:MAG: hypothetical protein HUN05_07935 [Desulfobacter sp.]|nr:MAG: hypothetical protein HUN05_07935 [Desulfobacter sp.]
MGYYQSAVKQHGMMVVSAVLALFLVAGCATHKAENLAPEKDVKVVDNAGPRLVEAVSVSHGQGMLEVWIQGSQPFEYTSIKQSFPFAVSVYLPDTRLRSGLVPESVADPRVSSIKAGYADEGRTTAKIDILMTQDLQYQVREQGERLGIIFQEEVTKTAMPLKTEALETPAANAASDKTMNQEDLVIPDAQAMLTHIEFDTTQTGQSDIRIQTSHPVRYETRQAGPDYLYLILHNTRIPEHHQRPLLPRYFKSAVERVDPGPNPDNSKDTRVEIKIRDQVPF